MIMLSNKFKKVYDVFMAVGNELTKQNLEFDGVIDLFNDGTDEGLLLKLYATYNPKIDLCIWCYLPNERDANNQMIVKVGHHCNCLDNNLWNEDLPHEVFTENRAKELHSKVRDYIIDTIKRNLNRGEVNGKE